MSIQLNSEEYIITNIKKQTKAKGFKELAVGDTFTLINNMERLGRSGNRRYAVMYQLKSKGNILAELSANDMLRRLKNFEYTLYATFNEVDTLCASMPLETCNKYINKYGDNNKACIKCLEEVKVSYCNKPIACIMLKKDAK